MTQISEGRKSESNSGIGEITLEFPNKLQIFRSSYQSGITGNKRKVLCHGIKEKGILNVQNSTASKKKVIIQINV